METALAGVLRVVGDRGLESAGKLAGDQCKEFKGGMMRA